MYIYVSEILEDLGGQVVEVGTRFQKIWELWILLSIFVFSIYCRRQNCIMAQVYFVPLLISPDVRICIISEVFLAACAG